MQILVTGGCGFIGSHIVAHHLTRGDRVIVVDDLSTGTLENCSPFLKEPRLTIHQADLLTWPGLEAALQHCQRIYHFAAVVGMFRILKQPVHLHDTNILATDRLFKLVSQLSHRPKIVLASSSSVYGHSQPGDLQEEALLSILPPSNLFSNYAISKMTDEAMAVAYHKQHGLNVIIARLFNTVGPRQVGQYGMVIPRFVAQACTNKPLTVFGDGQQTRSFCDVRDTVVALEKLCDNPKSLGQIVNVGNAQEITILALAEKVKALAESASLLEFVSYREAYGNEWTEITQRRPDLTKFNTLTGGFQHRWTLDATLSDLIHRFRTQRLSSI